MGLYDEGEAATSSGWMPIVWMGVSALVAALVWPLCLPSMPTHLADAQRVSDVVRLDWFCCATLLGFVLWYAARSSWLVGVVAWALLSAQLVGVADEAVDRLHATGLANHSADLLYLAAGLQVVLFSLFAAFGLRAYLARRRWARVVRALSWQEPTRRRADHRLPPPPPN